MNAPLTVASDTPLNMKPYLTERSKADIRPQQTWQHSARMCGVLCFLIPPQAGFEAFTPHMLHGCIDMRSSPSCENPFCRRPRRQEHRSGSAKGPLGPTIQLTQLMTRLPRPSLMTGTTTSQSDGGAKQALTHPTTIEL